MHLVTYKPVCGICFGLGLSVLGIQSMVLELAFILIPSVEIIVHFASRCSNSSAGPKNSPRSAYVSFFVRRSSCAVIPASHSASSLCFISVHRCDWSGLVHRCMYAASASECGKRRTQEMIESVLLHSQWDCCEIIYAYLRLGQQLSLLPS
jgi:hypothetical protein